MNSFPGLPAWFFRPAGLWEATSGCFLVLGTFASQWKDQSDKAGLLLSLTYLGGTLFASILLKDSEGHTFMGGKTKAMGKAGRLLVLPGLITTGVLVWLAFNKDNGSLPKETIGLCYAAGFVWGMVCEKLGDKSKVA